MDVGAWLRNLGLGRYEQAFRDNAVDGDVLLGHVEGVGELTVKVA